MRISYFSISRISRTHSAMPTTESYSFSPLFKLFWLHYIVGIIPKHPCVVNLSWI